MSWIRIKQKQEILGTFLHLFIPLCNGSLNLNLPIQVPIFNFRTVLFCDGPLMRSSFYIRAISRGTCVRKMGRSWHDSWIMYILTRWLVDSFKTLLDSKVKNSSLTEKIMNTFRSLSTPPPWPDGRIGTVTRSSVQPQWLDKDGKVRLSSLGIGISRKTTPH